MTLQEFKLSENGEYRQKPGNSQCCLPQIGQGIRGASHPRRTAIPASQDLAGSASSENQQFGFYLLKKQTNPSEATGLSTEGEGNKGISFKLLSLYCTKISLLYRAPGSQKATAI